MEKYYRVSDVNEILEKLAKEPAYYHDGESFYDGVCAVEGALMCLEPVELEEPKVGKWLKAECSEKDGDAICSTCGHRDWSDCNYCSNCGAKMN